MQTFASLAHATCALAVVAALFTVAVALADGTNATPAVVIEEGDDWVACDFTRDIEAGSALDFSARLDAPAGKYGWLKAVGEHFEFEGLRGVPQRFYGANVCMGLNVPSHEQADALVERLARMGYNSIRIHHHDRRLVLEAEDGSFFNTENLDRFDYLYAAAIKRGLYLTTDIFVSRPVTWRDIGEDRDGEVGLHAFKGLTIFHEGAFASWAEFAKNFLEHVNPYTGRAYRDEPALPLLCLVNEGWLCTSWFQIRDMECVSRRYDEWRARMLAQHGPDFMTHSLATNVIDANCWGDKNGATALFLADCERETVGRKIDFLKSLGCRALLTTGNHGPENAPNQRVRATPGLDYVDTHCYESHPKFLGKETWQRWWVPSQASNGNPSTNPDGFALPYVSWARMAGKPFTISEFNYCGPAFNRGIAGLSGGALACLQDWSGVWRFEYGSSLDRVFGPSFVPNYFAVSDDPIMMATDRTFASLFLRADAPVAAPRINLTVDTPSLMPEGPGKGDCEEFKVAPKRKDAVWMARVSVSMEDIPGEVNLPLSEWGYRKYGNYNTNALPLERLPVYPFARNDSGRGVFVVGTERTCGAFGPVGVALRAGALSVTLEKAAATVTVTSLDGVPIAQSSRLLLSHLTDAHGNGTAFEDKDCTICLSFGKPPILVRDGKASISLALCEPEAYKVFELALDGRRRAEIPAAVRNGRLEFCASVRGTDGRAVLEYEIAKVK